MSSTTSEKIKVMEAFARGEVVQWRSRYRLPRGPDWQTLKGDSWNWVDVEYRIAPKKPRKFVRYFLELIDSRLFIGSHFPKKEEAEKVCANWNLGLPVPKYRVVAYEMTEIVDHA